MRAGPCASSRPMVSAAAPGSHRESACIVYVSPVLARLPSRFKNSTELAPPPSEMNFHRSWVDMWPSINFVRSTILPYRARHVTHKHSRPKVAQKDIMQCQALALANPSCEPIMHRTARDTHSLVVFSARALGHCVVDDHVRPMHVAQARFLDPLDFTPGHNVPEEHSRGGGVGPGVQARGLG